MKLWGFIFLFLFIFIISAEAKRKRKDTKVELQINEKKICKRYSNPTSCERCVLKFKKTLKLNEKNLHVKKRDSSKIKIELQEYMCKNCKDVLKRKTQRKCETEDENNAEKKKKQNQRNSNNNDLKAKPNQYNSPKARSQKNLPKQLNNSPYDSVEGSDKAYNIQSDNGRQQPNSKPDSVRPSGPKKTEKKNIDLRQGSHENIEIELKKVVYGTEDSDEGKKHPNNSKKSPHDSMHGPYEDYDTQPENGRDRPNSEPDSDRPSRPKKIEQNNVDHREESYESTDIEEEKVVQDAEDTDEGNNKHPRDQPKSRPGNKHPNNSKKSPHDSMHGPYEDYDTQPENGRDRPNSEPDSDRPSRPKKIEQNNVDHREESYESTDIEEEKVVQDAEDTDEGNNKHPRDQPKSRPGNKHPNNSKKSPHDSMHGPYEDYDTQPENGRDRPNSEPDSDRPSRPKKIEQNNVDHREESYESTDIEEEKVVQDAEDTDEGNNKHPRDQPKSRPGNKHPNNSKKSPQDSMHGPYEDYDTQPENGRDRPNSEPDSDRPSRPKKIEQNNVDHREESYESTDIEEEKVVQDAEDTDEGNNKHPRDQPKSRPGNKHPNNSKKSPHDSMHGPYEDYDTQPENGRDRPNSEPDSDRPSRPKKIEQNNVDHREESYESTDIEEEKVVQDAEDTDEGNNKHPRDQPKSRPGNKHPNNSKKSPQDSMHGPYEDYDTQPENGRDRPNSEPDSDRPSRPKKIEQNNVDHREESYESTDIEEEKVVQDAEDTDEGNNKHPRDQPKSRPGNKHPNNSKKSPHDSMHGPYEDYDTQPENGRDRPNSEPDSDRPSRPKKIEQNNVDHREESYESTDIEEEKVVQDAEDTDEGNNKHPRDQPKSRPGNKHPNNSKKSPHDSMHGPYEDYDTQPENGRDRPNSEPDSDRPSRPKKIEQNNVDHREESYESTDIEEEKVVQDAEDTDEGNNKHPRDQPKSRPGNKHPNNSKKSPHDSMHGPYEDYDTQPENGRDRPNSEPDSDRPSRPKKIEQNNVDHREESYESTDIEEEKVVQDAEDTDEGNNKHPRDQPKSRPGNKHPNNSKKSPHDSMHGPYEDYDTQPENGRDRPNSEPDSDRPSRPKKIEQNNVDHREESYESTDIEEEKVVQDAEDTDEGNNKHPRDQPKSRPGNKHPNNSKKSPQDSMHGPYEDYDIQSDNARYRPNSRDVNSEELDELKQKKISTHPDKMPHNSRSKQPKKTYDSFKSNEKFQEDGMLVKDARDNKKGSDDRNMDLLLDNLHNLLESGGRPGGIDQKINEQNDVKELKKDKGRKSSDRIEMEDGKKDRRLKPQSHDDRKKFSGDNKETPSKKSNTADGRYKNANDRPSGKGRRSSNGRGNSDNGTGRSNTGHAKSNYNAGNPKNAGGNKNYEGRESNNRGGRSENGYKQSRSVNERSKSHSRQSKSSSKYY